ncbi:MAG TPA: hypothetical protein VM433_15050 [Mycobacteriales bacterium]|nr:hypothetical protein [Mycobacteriales bacterium]
MGLLGGMIKAGVAKKVYDEARKPHNQAKIKQMLSKATGKGSGGTGSSGPGAGQP